MIKLFLATYLFLMLEILVYTIYCISIYTCIVSFLSPVQAFRFEGRLGIMLVYLSEWLQKNSGIVAVRKTFTRFFWQYWGSSAKPVIAGGCLKGTVPGFQFSIQHLMQKDLLVCCKPHSLHQVFFAHHSTK